MITATTPSELRGTRLTDRSLEWEEGNLRVVLREEWPKSKLGKITVAWRGLKSGKPYYFKTFDNYKNAKKRWRQCVNEAKKLLAESKK